MVHQYVWLVYKHDGTSIGAYPKLEGDVFASREAIERQYFSQYTQVKPPWDAQDQSTFSWKEEGDWDSYSAHRKRLVE